MLYRHLLKIPVLYYSSSTSTFRLPSTSSTMVGVVTRAKRSATAALVDVPGSEPAESKPRLARFAAVKKQANTITANGKQHHRRKTTVTVKKDAVLPQVSDAVPISEELAVPATPVKSGLKSPYATPVKSGKSPYKSPVKAALPARAAPAGWHETYTLIQELRTPRDAPVDSMGCEALIELPPLADAKTGRYQVLIALMLSSQTKDQTVAQAIRNLQAHGLTVDNILKTDATTLNSLICQVGFHNNKTKFIAEATRILKEQHDSDVPRTLEELVSLPGVGPKMAFITLSAAHGIDVGIGIDTHMHRIMNILGWVSSKDPEGTRVQLESWLPREHWPHVNLVFVGFGQMLQQERAKLLRRCCLSCTRPVDALKLVFRLGVPPVFQCKATKETVLHWAAQSGDAELLAYVTQKVGRASWAIADAQGRLPVDAAASDQARAFFS